MKKNKKFKKTTPVIETREAVPGSVGEFIEILKQFPADSKFTLNGSVDIGSVDGGQDTISCSNSDPLEDEAVVNAVADLLGVRHECEDGSCTSCDEPDEEMSYEDEVMNGHIFGINDSEFIDSIRHVSSEYLLTSPITMPNKEQLNLERQLGLEQFLTLDEIRNHNAFIAENLAEMHRREIAALLEYQTQCLAHFGLATNRVMCDIVDESKKNK